MLNLIVVGNPDYYSFFSDSKGEESFPVSRLFESTPDSLRKKLLPLTSKTYQFLQELPVIFMTEPEFEVDEEGNTGGYYSHIRIGRISNIRAKTINREKVLAFNYDLTDIIGKKFLTSG